MPLHPEQARVPTRGLIRGLIRGMGRVLMPGRRLRKLHSHLKQQNKTCFNRHLQSTVPIERLGM
jgi:hypothetical protein